eukprot:2202849-Rhodomonas_salina.1
MAATKMELAVQPCSILFNVCGTDPGAKIVLLSRTVIAIMLDLGKYFCLGQCPVCYCHCSCLGP